MNIVALPTSYQSHLTCELKLVKSRDREDALQEAWLAQLEGRSPARAVNTYANRERRHRKRQFTGVLRHVR